MATAVVKFKMEQYLLSSESFDNIEFWAFILWYTKV